MNEELKAKLKEAVRTGIEQAERDGYLLTDSDMFKYTPVYTGDAWDDSPGRSAPTANRT